MELAGRGVLGSFSAMKTSCKLITTTERPIAEARALLGSFLRAMVDGCPLRFQPCMIAGPNDGFLIAELGFAVANGFEPVR